MIRNGSSNKVTGYRMPECRWSWAEGGMFLFIIFRCHGAFPASYPMLTWRFFPEIQGDETWSSTFTPSSTQVKDSGVTLSLWWKGIEVFMPLLDWNAAVRVGTVFVCMCSVSLHRLHVLCAFVISQEDSHVGQYLLHTAVLSLGPVQK